MFCILLVGKSKRFLLFFDLLILLNIASYTSDDTEVQEFLERPIFSEITRIRLISFDLIFGGEGEQDVISIYFIVDFAVHTCIFIDARALCRYR